MPSGPLPVSRITEFWTDNQRSDPFVGAPPASRTELVVWIWYPSTPAAGQRAAEYLPASWRRAAAPKGLLALLMRDYSAIHGHSSLDGPLSPALPRYPIVVLRAGAGALTIQYTTLAEDLASHGYVVVGFDAPYRTFAVVFPDGRVVTRPQNLNPENLAEHAQAALADELLRAWTSDIGSVLDRLARLNASPHSRFRGRLNLQEIGVVGHSLGGATAAQFCHDDPRARVGVDIDGRLFGRVFRDGINRPFMFLLEDLNSAPARDPVGHQIVGEITSVYERLPQQTRAGFWIRGASHFSFTDSLLERSWLVRAVMRVAGVLDLEPRRGLKITGDVVRRFLDVNLKGMPAESLENLPAQFPELHRLDGP